MVLTFHARENLGDVIQTPDQTCAKIKASRFEFFDALPSISLTIKAVAEKCVDGIPKRRSSAALFFRQTRRNIGIQGQGRSHGLMLEL